MKKIILIGSVLISLFSAINISLNMGDNKQISSLSLDNIEALAESEIEFIFCAQTQATMCVVYSDGYFVTGYRQYEVTVYG